MSKNNLKKIDRVKNSISMEEFLTHYLNDGIKIECKLSHKDLKKFNNPYLMCVSYEFASANIELVLTNKIILVSDRYSNIAPYINPLELRKLEQYQELTNQLKYLSGENLKDKLLLYQLSEIEKTIQLLKLINKDIEQFIEGNDIYVKKYKRG